LPGWLRLVAGAARAGLALLCIAPYASPAAEAPPQGTTVTVVHAARSCFPDTVSVYGILIPRDEVAVRPDRPGLKVTEVMVDPGQTVTEGQALARLAPPEGGASSVVNAPVAGTISSSTVVIGAIASGKGEPLFEIINRSEFDLAAQVPTRDLARLKDGQAATIKIVGAGDLAGKVHRVAATVDPASQLGQVFITVTTSRPLLVNLPGRASIKTGESCGISVPLSAIFYGDAGTVVQVVRGDRVETHRVQTGSMSAGQVEIRQGLSEGDVVVARAGALLREGDVVRPVAIDAPPSGNPRPDK
jgi:multidrug efflux pump subunit AcrA (membrane-fusion protein)